MPAESNHCPRSFPSTRWTVVELAGQPDGTAQFGALGALLANYRPPMLTYLRWRWSMSAEQAEDVVQSFILKKVLEKRLLARADRERGSFRAFLRKALDYFAIDLWKAKKAVDGAVPLEEVEQRLSSDDGGMDVFDEAWVREVLAEAAGRMREMCQREARDEIWGIFEARVLAPAVDGTRAASYEILMERFGIQTPGQAHNLLVTAKRWYERCLKDVIAEYAPGQEEDEIRELIAIVARGPAG